MPSIHAATWIDLEIIILSEVKLDTERQYHIPHDVTYRQNPKKKRDTNEFIYKKEIDAQT